MFPKLFTNEMMEGEEPILHISNKYKTSKEFKSVKNTNNEEKRIYKEEKMRLRKLKVYTS